MIKIKRKMKIRRKKKIKKMNMIRMKTLTPYPPAAKSDWFCGAERWKVLENRTVRAYNGAIG